MTERRRPLAWRSSDEAIKAVQVAFDVEEAVITAIRRAAFESNLSSSDQIRVLLGLPVVRQAKRPRLTVSLAASDYEELGRRFGIDPADRLAIKQRVADALVEFGHTGKFPRLSRKGRQEES